MEIPQPILALNKAVTLVSDVIFVNGLGLFVSMLRKIKFTTLEYIPKLTKSKLGHSLKKVISLLMEVDLTLGHP